MNIAFIGDQGHTAFVIDTIQAHPQEFKAVAVAPAFPDENMSGLIHSLNRIGQAPNFYSDFYDILQKENVDICVNCAIPAYMAAPTVAFLSAGVSVFAEKPMAISLEELDQIESACRTSGAHVAAILNYRYAPAFSAAYQAVAQGMIGQPRIINAQKSYKLGNRPDYYKVQSLYGGTIPWVGVHAIDWIACASRERFLQVQGFHSSMDNCNHGELDVSAVCCFELSNEVLATVTLDYFRPQNAPTHADDRLRIVGTQGIIEVQNGKTLLVKDNIQELPLESNVPSFFVDFANQVKTGSPCRISSSESIELMRVAIGARISAEQKEKFIY